MLRQEWRYFLYCILLMNWFNWLSHGSQDNYTSMMRTQKELNNAQASRASILMKTGACVGGFSFGFTSKWVGRRRIIILCTIGAMALIPPWILTEGEGAPSASGFFIQGFIQGAWGVIPIHLNEFAPPAFRSTFPGLTYQLGNMLSAPAAQVVNHIAEKFQVRSKSGNLVDGYGPTMGTTVAIVATMIILTTAFGPERRGRELNEGEMEVAAAQGQPSGAADPHPGEVIRD